MQWNNHSIFTIFSSLFIFDLCASVSVPNFIRPCEHTSQECLKNAIQLALPGFIQGVPELGIESLDPFVINKLELSLPGGLKIEFTQGSSKGLRKCIVDSARLIEDKLEMQLHCSLIIKGKYKSSGRLLMFAIDGDGDSMIKCKNIKIQFLFKLRSTTEQNGQKYVEIQNFKAHHSFDGQVFYRMNNLIKGNPQISNLVVEFMNRNWRMVADEFGKPIVEFGISAVLKNIKKLFKNVPMDQLFKVPIIF